MAEVDTITKIWKPILGFEGYYSVSSKGNVRRERNGPNTFKGKLRKPNVNPQGYRRMKLFKKGRSRWIFVHRIVARAFIGPRPNGKYVNHKDSNPANNDFRNLEYVTRKGNAAHAIKFNRQARGERVGTSKLNARKVRVIRRLLLTQANTKVAREFNVGVTTIASIKFRRTWKHI